MGLWSFSFIVSFVYALRNTATLFYQYEESTNYPVVVPPAIAGNFGSDMLYRPDDEDSPEFKEYLRQLLKLQANRAKSGHASPSSGSADAYIAKLTRLKIEKNMRLRAGLPNDPLDYSYKPEDYAAAIYEGQEPVVSSSAGLVAGGATGKVRSVTADELALAKAAEENVRRALEAKMRQQIDGIDADAPNSVDLTRPSLPPSPPPLFSYQPPRVPNQLVKSDSEDDLLIDQLLGAATKQSTAQQKGKQKQQQIAQFMQQKSQERGQQAVVAEVQEQVVQVQVQPPPPPKQQPQQQQQKVQQQAPKASNQQPQQIKSKQPQQQQQQQQQPKQQQQQPKQNLQNQEQQKPQQQQVQQKQQQQQPKQQQQKPQASNKPAPGSSPDIQLKRKVDADEVETLGKALEWLVKHRGGGRFGMGRLEGAEVDELANSLRAALRTMEKDSSLAEPVKVQPKQRPQEQKLLPKLPLSPAAAASDSAAPAAAPPAAAALPKAPKPVPAAPAAPAVQVVQASAVKQEAAKPRQPKQQAQQATAEAPSDASVPIALGLDKFLQNPSQFQVEELAALRDGIIQCLGLIQAEISSRPVMIVTAPVAPPPVPVLPSSVASLEQPVPLDRELKQTLGILLKHRGGPGFGHGRLEGKELELLEQKLRSVAQKLAEEAQSA